MGCIYVGSFNHASNIAIQEYNVQGIKPLSLLKSHLGQHRGKKSVLVSKHTTIGLPWLAQIASTIDCISH